MCSEEIKQEERGREGKKEKAEEKRRSRRSRQKKGNGEKSVSKEKEDEEEGGEMMRVLPALSLSCHDNQVVNEGHLQEDIAAVSALIPAPSPRLLSHSPSHMNLGLPFMHFRVIGN